MAYSKKERNGGRHTPQDVALGAHQQTSQQLRTFYMHLNRNLNQIMPKMGYTFL